MVLFYFFIVFLLKIYNNYSNFLWVRKFIYVSDFYQQYGWLLQTSKGSLFETVSSHFIRFAILIGYQILTLLPIPFCHKNSFKFTQWSYQILILFPISCCQTNSFKFTMWSYQILIFSPGYQGLPWLSLRTSRNSLPLDWSTP